MPELEPPPGRCTRRSVLRGGAVLLPALTAGLLSGVTGCGVRWEGMRGADRQPSTGPDPLVTALLGELARCRAAERAARAQQATSPGTDGTSPTSLPTVLVRLHVEQQRVLRRRLGELGQDPLPAGPDPPAGPGTAGRLLAAESAGLDRAGRAAVASVPGEDIALVAAAHVQRVVAVQRLGGAVVPWPAPMVATPQEGARLRDVTRSAEYGLAVAAAQAGRADAAAARQGLARIVARRRVLEALAPDDSPVPLGHVLPFPVRTPQSATRLGILMSRRLSTGTLAGLPDAAGQPDAVATLLCWVVDSELVGLEWGAPAQALPGLISP